MWEDTTNNKFTGQIINKNTTSVVVDYYTATLSTGAGIASTTGTGTYMKGTDVSIDAVIASNYSWNKWKTLGGSTESATKTYTIHGISKTYSLSAVGIPTFLAKRLTSTAGSSPLMAPRVGSSQSNKVVQKLHLKILQPKSR